MRQIIAMGGGGFLMEPDNLALDRYILRQASSSHPRVCFVPTASGDSDLALLRFYRAFSSLDCQPNELCLYHLLTADLESFVMEQDVIYVGGGNTRNMLALWREWGLDRILRQAYEAGVILSGISAGGNCWFEECTTDSIPGALNPWPCLGLLPGSFSPHYDGEEQRRPTLHRLLKNGQIRPGYASENSSALHFVDGELVRAICSKPSARAYRVECQGDEVVETPLDMEFLTVQ